VPLAAKGDDIAGLHFFTDLHVGGFVPGHLALLSV
jgi:hypothetical protein